MSVSNRPTAYGPILRAILNQAVHASAGIKLEVKSESEAIQTRQRLYKVRDLENKGIAKALGAEFAGPWDPIRILIEKIDGVWYVILTKDDILLGLANVTDIASGERLGTAGDLLKQGQALQAKVTTKDPFADEDA